MEALAYTHACASYEKEMGIEHNLPELEFNWKNIPSSAWIGAIALGVMAAALSSATPAHAIKANTPSGRCLNARTGPGFEYGVVKCVRNGATLLPVVTHQGPWLKLSSGRWVYGPYTSAGSGTGKGTGGQALIKPGARSSSVRSIQTRLNHLGYYVGPTGVDGVYGRYTASAVRSFQTKNGLLVDGIVGPRTLRAMGLS
jgi:Putative peptidoglycan binding domain